MPKNHTPKTPADFEKEADALWKSINTPGHKNEGKHGLMDELDYISETNEEGKSSYDYGFYDGGYGQSYDYDFGSTYLPLSSKKQTPSSEEKRRDARYWEDYEKTGKWYGYSYLSNPTLDYRYIEQMANLFSAKYKVSVEVGDEMAIDIEKKVLTYDPTALMFDSKANLIASLLHEIGHLRHTTPFKNLVSPYLSKYPKSAPSVLNIFEDFRVDELMKKSYDGAPEIFKSQIPKIRDMAKELEKQGRALLPAIEEQIRIYKNKRSGLSVGDIVMLHPESRFYPAQYDPKGGRIFRIDEEEPPIYYVQWENGAIFDYFSTDLILVKQKMIGTEETEEEKELEAIRKGMENRENLFDYCAAILMTGYGEKPEKFIGTLEERIEKTERAISPYHGAKNTQEGATILDKQVFPVIEDLLKELKDGSEEMQEMLGKETASMIMARALEVIDKQKQLNEETQVRGGSGPSENRIPSTWVNGEYAPLKESVQSGINELVRLLTFLRRTEQAIRYEGHKKRGKLDAKTLYRFRMGDIRLFKQKTEVRDTLTSFVFSLMIDISGSMAGPRMAHAARGLVLLAEVFEKMGIPYEVQTFNNTFKRIKSFEDTLDARIKRVIGGMPRINGGGTNLHLIFGKPSEAILNRPERNKYAIILSDGGVGNELEYWRRNFEKWREKNLRPIGIGLACGDDVVMICQGSGASASSPGQLPSIFSDILKGLLNKKKK